jgi:hypothetical protein
MLYRIKGDWTLIMNAVSKELEEKYSIPRESIPASLKIRRKSW